MTIPATPLDDRFAERREAMVAAGYWRDETLLDHFDRLVAATPDKTAIVATRSETGEETRLTYGEFDRLSRRVALGLRQRGIGRGDVVSFQLPNWWEFPVLHLACLRIGAVSNPLMTIFRERELGFMLKLAESRLLVVPARFRNFDFAGMAERLQDDLPDLRVIVVGGDGDQSFDQLLGPAGSELDQASLPTSALSPDQIIQLLYTSGTTGEPKGVMHSSNTMLSNLVPFAERLGLGGDDVIHMPSPMTHQLGFMYGLMMPAMLGATAVLQDVFEPQAAIAQINREGATFSMGATPFLNDLSDVLESSGQATDSLRVYVAAGAPIPRALVVRARRTLGAAIISAWGMSENGAVTTTRIEDPEDKATETDGCALPGIEVRVIGTAGRPLPPGGEGDLQVRGCSNFLGYLKRPELGKTDADGWFDTGDIARMDAEGYIRIAGRSKDTIIRGGENIPVVEVEELLFRHPAVAAAAIVGYPDPRLGERACAFVTLRPGASLSFDEMVAYLKAQRMAAQYIPERLKVVEDLPRTPSGKVQKFKLREAMAPTPVERR